MRRAFVSIVARKEIGRGNVESTSVRKPERSMAML